MEDLGCAKVSQGIVVMREWKIKDAQWKVCNWERAEKRLHMSLNSRGKTGKLITKMDSTEEIYLR